ncbi:uncharacterized protein LOC118180640 [Stegodyphus dumicola]|uniref:uncharacterized protein LOC118180640 n=1 Tax=Stegodyphus dumicola TaxID=202533 RepID=UPI0015AC506A|nr:uncharacterized protein LOC118180640 [Stegodyphus dumicola]
MLPVIKNFKEEMEKIAESELGETELIRKESLEKLKQLLKEVPDLNPLLEDDFLIKFLRVRKFNVQRALNTLIKYYATKKMYSKLYSDLLPSEMKTTLEKKALYVLPKKPTFGPSVYWGRFGKHLEINYFKCLNMHTFSLTHF